MVKSWWFVIFVMVFAVETIRIFAMVSIVFFSRVLHKVYEDLPYYMMDSVCLGLRGADYDMLTGAQYYLASSREEKTGIRIRLVFFCGHQLFWECNILARQALWEANLCRWCMFFLKGCSLKTLSVRNADDAYLGRELNFGRLCPRSSLAMMSIEACLSTLPLSSLLMVCLWRRMWMCSDSNTTEQLPRGLYSTKPTH